MELKHVAIIIIFFSLLCSYYVTDIKKLELHLLVVIILFMLEFGYAQDWYINVENNLYQTVRNFNIDFDDNPFVGHPKFKYIFNTFDLNKLMNKNPLV